VALLAGCGGSRVAASDTASQSGAAQSGSTDTSANAPATGTGGTPATDTSAAAPAVKPDTPASTGTATNTTAAAPAGAAGTAPSVAASVVDGGKTATAAKGATKTTKAAISSSAAGAGGTHTTKGNAVPAAPSDAGLSGAAAAIAANVKSAQIFGGSAPCKPGTLSPVNIGNVSTLSGILGQLFAPVVPALKTFVASQNACGGLNGHPIKLFLEDDQDDPSTAVSKVNDEIKNDHVLAFVGNIQVLTDDAIVPTIKRSGIPVIGSDITNNTWFTNPLFFPQGSGPESVSYGYAYATANYFHKKKVGDIWCLEVPQACTQIDGALKDLGPKLGVDVVKTIQVSMTSPSYTTQCLDFKSSGADVISMTIDAASQVRLAKSCKQVGYFPAITSYPLSVGNESEFFGEPWLGNDWIPINTFPWMASDTPAEKYYQAMVKKYNPGFTTGDAASLGWSAGGLLVAAATNLSANPTTQEFLNNLYTFKGQEFTHLGGLTPAPLTYSQGANPKVPYCFYSAVSNKENTAWGSWDSQRKCTDLLAGNDPQSHGG
jgi:branched-chain amino acid transport system substrate-binding protein